MKRTLEMLKKNGAAAFNAIKASIETVIAPLELLKNWHMKASAKMITSIGTIDKA